MKDYKILSNQFPNFLIHQFANSLRSGGRGDFLLIEEISIKKELIMRNKANFRKSQMFITIILTMSYSEKMKLDTWSKQTQSKPILPAIAGKIAPLFRMPFILMGQIENSFTSWTLDFVGFEIGRDF